MRTNDLKKASAAEQLCVIVLMFLFAAAMLLLVAMGTSAYGSITKGMNTNYSLRTSLSYVAAKIRQGDKSGQISIKTLNGMESLVIEENINGTFYQTWVYAYDGGIYEMYAEKNTEFQPQDGMRIIDIEQFEVKQASAKLFSLMAEDKSGKTEHLTVAVRA